MRGSVFSDALAFLRNTWRGLTSMRTALVLLFLLALAALPGALLPQWSTSRNGVQDYFDKHPTIAPVLDELGAFNVFGSVWFSAIYVLLFVSLVGCLVPRTGEYLRNMRARPVRTPRNLARMPHHSQATVDSSVDEAIAVARKRLRGWRVDERDEGNGTRSLSAERGYLREAGNLVFHFALLGLLVVMAAGAMYGYEGRVIVKADGSSFCNSGTYNYDSFEPGLRVDGTGLNPYCVRVNDFDVKYQPNGQPKSFHADVDYQAGESLDNDVWKPYGLKVNEPLRLAGDRVYLTGNGYAPVFTVTFPNGAKRTSSVQWKPMNMQTFLSQGATKFSPPGMPDEQRRQRNQLAITGLFAPTASFEGKVLSSKFPDLRDPAVAIDVLKGQLGIATGEGQSIFSIDQSMVESGKLNRVARENLRVGEQLRLDDGTVIHFDGVKRFVNLQIAHDPFQEYALVFAIAIIVGLGASLSIKRRRIWVRAGPTDGAARTSPDGSGTAPTSTLIEVGGLARTDQAGYGEEFTKLSGDVLGKSGHHSAPEDSHGSASARERNS
ncbi:cytochrome c biogenesis protein [Saccharopolyspora lacisalsi]|uniref:Cytochrome c biogenesis protein n=1 Tax=Halosaccharopolyspora lacisalsi TaxID=1000566 RepID=A0A839E2Q4_9PSEU|nr:cytochrome c biogenesis protein ResB [Halosaccharopolyspora lacisalsi]MBA8827149.1 cytochrome c biogenesis protein [Halosaccharopolyspora lacisalsi]